MPRLDFSFCELFTSCNVSQTIIPWVLRYLIFNWIFYLEASNIIHFRALCRYFFNIVIIYELLYLQTCSFYL